MHADRRERSEQTVGIIRCGVKDATGSAPAGYDTNAGRFKLGTGTSIVVTPIDARYRNCFDSGVPLIQLADN
jgi:hypothetical protein